MDVHHDGVVHSTTNRSQCLRAALGSRYFEAPDRESALKGLEHVRVVVDQKDSFARRHAAISRVGDVPHQIPIGAPAGLLATGNRSASVKAILTPPAHPVPPGAPCGPPAG